MPPLIACLLALVPPWAGADEPLPSTTDGPSISNRLIQDLEEELANSLDIESSTQKRRAFKNIVRDSLSLIKRHPGAPNRFRVLGIIFQTQKELLVLKNDERNRDGLLETCKKLVEAPYEYAAERLEPEVLLMQLELDSKGATEHERALSIAQLADSYRGTPAEVDSLIITSELAFNLGQAELLTALRYTLSHKFRESTKAIGFLKDRFAFKSTSPPSRRVAPVCRLYDLQSRHRHTPRHLSSPCDC